MSTTWPEIETTFYLDIVPQFGNVWIPGKGRSQRGVTKITVKGVTQSRPQKPKGVIVKLTLRFNEAAFMPLEPAAVIVIPDSMTATTIEVEAEDPNDQAAIEALVRAGKAVRG